MTREIKFRGKDVDTGGWIDGDLIQRKGYYPGIMFPYESGGKVRYGECVVEPGTVGQFTGLLDKNGKEIYEGDVVKVKEIGGYALEYIGVVRYYTEDCRFGIDTSLTNKFTKRILFTKEKISLNDGYCTITYTNEYEIIGNVFDNPELLKTETL